MRFVGREEVVLVTMPFQNIDHFKHIFSITKEDDVTLVWKAPYIGKQFRPGAPQNPRQPRKIATLCLKLIDESATDPAIAARLCDVTQDVAKVLTS